MEEWLGRKKKEKRAAEEEERLRAGQEKRNLRSMRTQFYLEHAKISINDSDALIVAAHSLFKKLESEGVEYETEEIGLIETLNEYIMLQSRSSLLVS